MPRKSPVRHKVRQHIRQNRPVKSFTRGRGTNPSKLLIRKKIITRFGAKPFGDLPLHKNFYIVTGLVDSADNRSRFRARIIATNPTKAKQIVNSVLQGEFGVKKLHKIEVLIPTPKNIERGKKIDIPKSWFEVTSSHPLYFIDKNTGMVKEFHQEISYPLKNFKK